MSIRLEEIPVGHHFRLAEDVMDDPNFEPGISDTLQEIFVVVQQSPNNEHHIDGDLSWYDETEDESFTDALSIISEPPENSVLVLGTKCNLGLSFIRGDRFVIPMAVSGLSYMDIEETDFRGDWTDEDDDESFYEIEDDEDYDGGEDEGQYRH